MNICKVEESQRLVINTCVVFLQFFTGFTPHFVGIEDCDDVVLVT